jgi:hypothetical protein
VEGLKANRRLVRDKAYLSSTSVTQAVFIDAEGFVSRERTLQKEANLEHFSIKRKR